MEKSRKIKISSVLFILILAIMLPLSCTDIANIEKSQSEIPILTMSEIHELGVKHNEALGKVLIGFRQNKVSQLQNPTEIQSIINSELNSYYRKAFNKKLNIKSAIEYSSKEVSKYFQLARESHRKNSSENITPIEMTIKKNKDYLSQPQIELLKELNEILVHAASDVENAISKLDAIQTIAQQELNDKEAQIILIGAEIGKASLDYWNENLNSWQEVLLSQGRQKPTMSWFDWSELAGADVAGAVGGAVGAAVVNVIPGAGQVGYVGAIVGGAAAGSATDAVMQAWNHFF